MHTHPHPQSQVPLGNWLIPSLGALTSAGLICTSTKETIYRLLAWMAIGWILYFAYGYEHSKAQIDRIALPSLGPADMRTEEEREEEYLHVMEMTEHVGPASSRTPSNPHTPATLSRDASKDPAAAVGKGARGSSN